MIELTEEQRQGLASPEPVLVDPQTHEEYVLVRKKVFDQLKGLLDDDARLMYPKLADLDPEDWEDAAIYEAIETRFANVRQRPTAPTRRVSEGFIPSLTRRAGAGNSQPECQ